jgi:hypothetical protein
VLRRGYQLNVQRASNNLKGRLFIILAVAPPSGGLEDEGLQGCTQGSKPEVQNKKSERTLHPGTTRMPRADILLLVLPTFSTATTFLSAWDAFVSVRGFVTPHVSDQTVAVYNPRSNTVENG